MSISDHLGKTFQTQSDPLPKSQKRAEGKSADRHRSVQTHQSRKADNLVHISLSILKSNDPHQILQSLAYAALKLTDASRCKVAYGYQKGQFRMSAFSNIEDSPQCQSNLEFKGARGGVYLELIENTPVLRLSREQLESHEAWRGLPEDHVSLNGLLGVRLTDEAARACGLLMVTDKKCGGEFSEEDENLLTQLAAMASISLQQIEARQQIEDRRQALQANNQRLQRVLAGSNDGYMEWNLSTGTFYASPRMLDILGEEHDHNLTVQEIVERTHTDEKTVIQTSVDRLKKGGKEKDRNEFEIRVLHHDGYYIWVEIRCKITERDGDGNALLVSGTFSDISERKRSQELLEINEEVARDRLREIETIYQSAPVGLCVLDLNLKYKRLNEYLAEINGLPVAVHIGRTIDDIAPDIAIELKPVLHRTITTGLPVSHHEIRARSAEPENHRYFLCHCYPLRNRDEEIFGLNVVLEDITERKRAENRAAHKAAELEAIINALPIHLLISHDPEGHYVTGSRSTQELLHMPPDANLSAIAPPEERPTHYRFLQNGMTLPPENMPVQRAVQGEQVRDFEMDLVFVDGTQRTIFGNAEPIRDENGTILGAIGAFIDITERKRSESRILDINATLEQRVQERTSQLQSLNRDLKRRAAQLQNLTLKLSEAEEKERRRLAEMLHDDLQQLLAAAKLQMGRISELAGNNPQIACVAKTIDKILTDSIRKTRNLSHELSPNVLSREGLTPALEWLGQQMEKKHGLEVSISSEEGAVPSSQPMRVFLYKAVNEILFNTVKHAGVDKARIELRRTKEGIEVEVLDQGRGFDPEERIKIGPENGFGLFSIRERIYMLGGEMCIESSPGQGSRFILKIPEPETTTAEEKSSDLRTSTQETDTAEELERKRIAVIVVDDHRMMREGLSNMLAKHSDIEVVAQAENGRKAVDLVSKHHPHVVLMDVSMPVMNGIEATREIKQRWPGTRVIALSMYEETDIHVAMIEAGAATYVTKMGPSDTLLSVVRGESPSRRTN